MPLLTRQVPPQRNSVWTRFAPRRQGSQSRRKPGRNLGVGRVQREPGAKDRTQTPHIADPIPQLERIGPGTTPIETRPPMANFSSLFRGAGAALLVTLLTACGGGDKGGTGGTGGGGANVDEGTVFEIEGTQTMQFSKKTFEASVGKVTIKLKNTATAPKAAMGHNIVVLKPGMDAVKWATELLGKGASLANDFLPEAVRGDTLGFTKVLGPGETENLTIEFSEPGEYPYVCTFAGHAGMMNGVITIK